MEGGYLFVETSPGQPGFVRIRKTHQAPPLPGGKQPGDSMVRFAAYFEDLEAARMHAHTRLRRNLADVEAGLYRTTVKDAVAAVESVDLPHRSIYVTPALETDPAVTQAVDARRRRHRWADRAWRVVAGIGVALLLLKITLGI
jgi:hypothetical protein